MYKNHEFEEMFMQTETSPYTKTVKKRTKRIGEDGDSIDDFSNVIVKPLREEEPAEIREADKGSMSETEIGVSRRYEKDQDDSIFDQDRSQKYVKTKVPALKLDFPAHMLRKISEDSL